jgi:O-antigen ligase
VNGTAPTSWAPAEDTGRRAWLLFVLLTLGVVATVAVTVATNGSVLAAVAPVMAVALVVAIWVAPMRVTLLGLVFLGLALDASQEGPWDSPVAALGQLLTSNLNKTIPVEALAIPLVSVLLGYLLIIRVHRVLVGSHVDDGGRARAARPMLWALALSFLTVATFVALGVRRGGDVQMAKDQVQNFVLLLLMAYLLAVSLRPRDYPVLGGLILGAGCIKSLMALWVHYTVLPTPATATAHGDSLLFAAAATILLARFVERPVRRNGLLCLAMLPLIFGGIIANNRRLAWVEVAATVFTLYLVSRRTPLKRFVTRAVVLSVPLLLAYVAIGWNSNSSVFAPVKVFRSVEDADVDGSTMFRDLENYNLLLTLRNNPIIGAGFGQQFDESVTEPDISFFKEYRYMPHNSVLGLWGFTGILGFTCLSMAVVVGVYLAARSYRYARLPDERAAAFASLAMVLIYLIQCWGDIGFSERRSFLLVGPALAVAGQLALSTGAWSVRPAKATAMSRRS